MAGYVIGVGFIAFALWRLRAGRVPAGADTVVGTVIEEVERTSTQTGRSTRVHAPRVAYRHPRTGAEEVLEPTSFGQQRFTPGDRIELVYDRAADRIRRPDANALRSTIVLIAVGIGFVVAQWVAT